MGKVKGPLLSIDASGKIGNALVFSKLRGSRRVSKYFVPRNPRSVDQTLQRSFLAFAVLAWRALSANEKSVYNEYVLNNALNMSGYNYFISDYIYNFNVPPEPEPEPIMDGLIAWWKLDETSGDYADSSGNNHTLVNSSMTYNPAGHLNGCAEADTYTDKIYCADPLLPAGDFSIEVWAKIPNQTNGYLYLFSQGNTPNRILPQFLSYKDVPDGHGRVCIDMCGSTAYLSVDTTFLNFAHVIITRSGSTVKLYVNGVNVPTGVTEGDSIGQNTNFWLINRFGESGKTIGCIDEARIYNRALTQEEVTHNFSL